MDKEKDKTEKQQKKEEVPAGEDDIDKLINGFEQGDLNLTNEDKQEEEEDPQTMAKIKQQYTKFMKQMQLGEEEGADMGMGNLGKAFEDLLKGLTDDDKTGEQIGKKFETMFNNLDNPDSFENAASQLLNQFMDKSLLEQPLKETKENYDKYFKESEEKNVNISQNYKKQYGVILRLLDVLKQTPENKKKMIELFNELQSYGIPPEGIAPSFGFF